MLISGITSCKNCEKGADSKQDKTTDLAAQGYEKGVVEDNTGLDGCGFMIVLEDTNPDDDTPGMTLNPIMGFPDEFKKDGLAVWVKYKKTEVMTTCMKGETVNVESVKKR